MANQLPQWVEILKELGIAGLVAGLLDALKNGTRDTVERKLKELTVEARAQVWNFILTDLARDGEDGARAAESLQKMQTFRQQLRPRPKNDGTEGAPYIPGDENKLNTAVAKFYAIFLFELKPIEPKKRWERPDEFRARLEAEERARSQMEEVKKGGKLKLFKFLGQMAEEKPEDFDSVIEAVIDDGLEQFLLRLLFLVKSPLANATRSIDAKAAALAPKIVSANVSLEVLRDNIKNWARR